MHIKNLNSTQSPTFRLKAQGTTAKNYNATTQSADKVSPSGGGPNSEDNIRLVYGLKVEVKTSQRYLKRYKNHLDELKKQNEELNKIGGATTEEKEARAKNEAFLQGKVDEYNEKIKKSTDALDEYTKGMSPILEQQIDKEAEKDVAKEFGEKVLEDGQDIESIIKKFAKENGKNNIMDLFKELQKEQEKSNKKNSNQSVQESNVDVSV
jgi:hypothetical protein